MVQSHGLQVITCLNGRSERTRMLAHDTQIAEVLAYEVWSAPATRGYRSSCRKAPWAPLSS